MPNYRIAQLDDITPVACPCGQSRRAFGVPENDAATVHVVDIKQDSEVHYHKRLTEVYVVLEGTGYLELDGEKVPVKPLTAVMIQPGCRHRAVGRMRILNVVTPPFDSADEWHEP